MDFTTIKKYDLFNNIPEEATRLIIEKFKELKYPKKSVIFHEGEHDKNIFIIESGLVKIVSYTNIGKEPTIILLKEGDIFGILILSEEARPFSAITLEDSTLLSIEKNTFIALLSEYPQLNKNFIKLLSKRITFLEKKLISISHTWSYHRIFSILQLLSEKFGKKEGDKTILEIKLTHQELANLIGTTRETVTKQLHKLEELGLIEVKRNVIIYHDKCSDFFK
ncbi:MAG: Crp/Fnr family transcriptional regulator [Deltaproteobacteria bacterium]|nr:MAG: Crp/Fnr family transcriptional regulator [Deltaproteobacteria bacterium]